MDVVSVKFTVCDFLIWSNHSWVSILLVFLCLDRNVLRNWWSCFRIISSLLEQMIVDGRLILLAYIWWPVFSSTYWLVSQKSASFSYLSWNWNLWRNWHSSSKRSYILVLLWLNRSSIERLIINSGFWFWNRYFSFSFLNSMSARRQRWLNNISSCKIFIIFYNFFKFLFGLNFIILLWKLRIQLPNVTSRDLYRVEQIHGYFSSLLISKMLFNWWQMKNLIAAWPALWINLEQSSDYGSQVLWIIFWYRRVLTF